jgi:hypothetical protein
MNLCMIYPHCIGRGSKAKQSKGMQASSQSMYFRDFLLLFYSLNFESEDKQLMKFDIILFYIVYLSFSLSFHLPFLPFLSSDLYTHRDRDDNNKR